PRAVVKAVRNTVEFVNSHREQILNQPLNCGGRYE
ncbi:electron transport complex subunit RsxG, partial [Vibrio vulnificus]